MHFRKSFFFKKFKKIIIFTEKKDQRGLYFMIKILLYFILFLCVSCGYVGMEEGERDSCNFRVDRGFVVKWKELPTPVYIHPSVPGIARKNFIYAMDMLNESWNYYSGKGRLFELIGEVETAVPTKENSEDDVNIFFVDQKHGILSSLQQGSTLTRNYFGGTMYEADIIVNNIHFRYHYERGDFDYSTYTNVPELSTSRSLASTSSRSFWQQFLYAFQSFLDFFSSFWKKTPDRVPSAQQPQIPKNKTDAISLYLHELLHFDALLHEKKGIMQETLAEGTIRRDITEIELSRLACGYGSEKNTM